MGIVNAFINQIGRELGRDAYRSLASNSRGIQRKKHNIEEKELILDQVINFQLSEDDQKTFRNLANLVEKAEHTDYEDFEWNELFYELDNKIDFCKANLSPEYKVQLEKLDEINAKNYKFIKSKHYNYVDSVIKYFENMVSDLSKKKISLAVVLTLFGLRASYLGEKIIYTVINILYLFILGFIFHNGWITFNHPKLFNGNLPNETTADLEVIKSAGTVLMGIAIGCYLLYFALGVYKISKYKKEIKKNIDSKLKFQTYKAQLLK